MRSQSEVYIKIELINKTTFSICESDDPRKRETQSHRKSYVLLIGSIG